MGTQTRAVNVSSSVVSCRLLRLSVEYAMMGVP